MKTNKKTYTLLLSLVLFFSLTTIDLNASECSRMLHIETIDEVGDSLEGGWAYTVEGAPAGYEKGFLVIVKENDAYKVQVQIGPSTLLGKNVVVKGKEINFDVMVEGDTVSVKLTAKGSTITGKSTSSEGSYTINGVKSISAE